MPKQTGREEAGVVGGGGVWSERDSTAPVLGPQAQPGP